MTRSPFRPTLRPFPAAALMTASLLFSGCGSRSVATTSLHADFQSAQAGEYAIEDNIGGKGDLTRVRQCEGIATADGGGANAAFDWARPLPIGGARGDLEVVYGQKPWNARTTDRLPRVVDDVKTARVDLE